jgi:type I restriction enzyme S subunit
MSSNGRIKKVRIGEVCKDKIQAISSKDKGIIKYVDISSVDNKTKRIYETKLYEIEDAPSRAKQILKKNDIIVSTVRPNLNAVAIVDVDFDGIIVGSTGYCVLRCKGIHYKYLFNFCQSRRFVSSLMRVAKGASYPAVSNSDVKNIQIPLPSQHDQIQIANTLDKVQGIIDVRKKQIEKLNEYIKSVFYTMFGDPVTNPMGWEIHMLGDLCDVKGGKRIPKGFRHVDYQTEHPYLRVVDFKDMSIETSNLKYIEEDIFKKIKNYTISKDDVYISIAGTIGLVGTIPDVLDRANLTENAAKLVLRDKKQLSKIFLAYYLVSPYGQTKTLEKTIATSQPKLALFRIKDIPTFLPPIQLQNQFASIVEKTEAQKELLNKSLSKMETLFDCLMDQYFS